MLFFGKITNKACVILTKFCKNSSFSFVSAVFLDFRGISLSFDAMCNARIIALWWCNCNDFVHSLQGLREQGVVTINRLIFLEESHVRTCARAYFWSDLFLVARKMLHSAKSCHITRHFKLVYKRIHLVIKIIIFHSKNKYNILS